MATRKTAESNTPVGKKSAPLDSQVADKLLELLSTDNEFRRLFKKDPLSALIKAGYKPSKAELESTDRRRPPPTLPGPLSAAPRIWSCCSVERIASKADVIKARAELKKMLTSGLAHIPPQLDASIAAARRVRR